MTREKRLARQRECMRRWRAAHPEETREVGRKVDAKRREDDEYRSSKAAYLKEWYEKHKDEERAKAASRYEANRETISEKRKLRRIKDPSVREANKNRNKAYRAANRLKVDSRVKAWHDAHPESRAAFYAKRNAKRRAASVDSSVTAEEWAARLEEFGHVCAYCLRKRPLSMDHVHPLSRGGKHAYENVIPACGSCNSRKGARGILSMLQ